MPIDCCVSVCLPPGFTKITLYDRALPGENQKALIFTLANRVIAPTDLGKKEWKEVLVLELAACIVISNHGFKGYRGAVNLTRTWGSRLNDVFEQGNNTSPLQTKYKGTMSYTNKLKSTEPGWIPLLYCYIERNIGNQASFEDLTRA